MTLTRLIATGLLYSLAVATPAAPLDIDTLLFSEQEILALGHGQRGGVGVKTEEDMPGIHPCILSILNLEPSSNSIGRVEIINKSHNIYLFFNSNAPDAMAIEPRSIVVKQRQISFSAKAKVSKILTPSKKRVTIALRPLYAQGIVRSEQPVAQYQVRVDIISGSRHYQCIALIPWPLTLAAESD